MKHTVEHQGKKITGTVVPFETLREERSGMNTR